MPHNGKITHKLKSKSHIISAEFFPPKSNEAAKLMLEAAQELENHHLDFVSITYGAGGSTRERTLEYGEILKDRFHFDVMPHLTCVGHSQEELRNILYGFRKTGFQNIMTLRGDPPKGEKDFKPHPDGFHYASELITFIKKEFPTFCLGAAGYPEKHPEATSMAVDLRNLKNKVDQGADFITTQLFFDNQHYYRFIKDCRSLGITVPIIPGILIPHSHELITRFCSFCGSSIPAKLNQKLKEAGNNKEKSAAIGIEWAYQQVTDLLKNNVPGVHFYVLNRSDLLKEVMDRISHRDTRDRL